MNDAQPIPGLPGGGDRDGDIGHPGHPGDGAGHPGHPGDAAGDAGNIGAIAERVRPKLKKPPLYKVLMLNDDYTPMEFVVYLLMQLFHMSQDRAEQIMLHIHTRGLGVCGVFPREIAETKVRQTLELARKNQHPLQCTMERA